MSLIIVLLIGVVIGMLVSRFIFREKPVGSLRVDESDPDYLKGEQNGRRKKHRRIIK